MYTFYTFLLLFFYTSVTYFLMVDYHISVFFYVNKFLFNLLNMFFMQRYCILMIYLLTIGHVVVIVLALF